VTLNGDIIMFLALLESKTERRRLAAA